jgi:hypothetical protein
MVRRQLSEQQWARLEGILLSERGAGRPPKDDALAWLRILFAIEDAHVQALADQPQQRRVGHPFLEQLHQHLADDAVVGQRLPRPATPSPSLA